MIKMLVDGDWLLYTAGFACQTTLYVAAAESGFHGPYESKTALYEDLGKQEEGGYEIYTCIRADPLDHTLHTTKQMISSARKAVATKFGVSEQDIDMTIYMDHSEFPTLRQRIAQIKPYKGNRTSIKPERYRDIRDYLIANYNTRGVWNIETDDALSIQQLEYNKQNVKSIIVAVDKDLLQVVGYHYNPNKGFKKVTREMAKVALFRQVLTGDSVDNIGGCYKIGAAKAEQLIKPGMSVADMWDEIILAYRTSAEKGYDYRSREAADAAIENYKLVRLLKEADEEATYLRRGDVSSLLDTDRSIHP